MAFFTREERKHVIRRHYTRCSRCKGRKFIVEPGKGPHIHLRCAGCGRGGMSKPREEELQYVYYEEW